LRNFSRRRRTISGRIFPRFALVAGLRLRFHTLVGFDPPSQYISESPYKHTAQYKDNANAKG
jgi:hypothetical protein